MTDLHRKSPLTSAQGERRWELGAKSLATAASSVLASVPGRLVLYEGVVFRDECGGPDGDLDLLVLTPRGIAAIAVTGTRSGEFGRRGNTLVGHAGSQRQVRQIARAARRLAQSVVGRTAAAASVPIFAVLALEGDMSPALRERPWFDIDGRPRISRAIDVVSAYGLGDYLRGRMWASPCRANVASYLDAELQRDVIARFDRRTARAPARHRAEACGHQPTGAEPGSSTVPFKRRSAS